jgi:hypothetical protein
LACAIAAAATDDVISDVVDLVRDESHGQNRLLLLKALAKSKRPEVQDFLSLLRNDPTLQVEVRRVLRTK